MNSDTYIPEWRTVQRVLALNSSAGGRELPEPHLPRRVVASGEGVKHVVTSHTSGCKMRARMIVPDPDGPNTTVMCAVCDAPNLMPRIARDLELSE